MKKFIVAMLVLAGSVVANDILAPSPDLITPQVPSKDLEKTSTESFLVLDEDVVVTPERKDALAFLSLVEQSKPQLSDIVVRECPLQKRDCN